MLGSMVVGSWSPGKHIHRVGGGENSNRGGRRKDGRRKSVTCCTAAIAMALIETRANHKKRALHYQQNSPCLARVAHAWSSSNSIIIVLRSMSSLVYKETVEVVDGPSVLASGRIPLAISEVPNQILRRLTGDKMRQ
nr:hypothetical protein CFP56_20414 [Quercus suber]